MSRTFSRRTPDGLSKPLTLSRRTQVGGFPTRFFRLERDAGRGKSVLDVEIDMGSEGSPCWTLETRWEASDLRSPRRFFRRGTRNGSDRATGRAMNTSRNSPIGRDLPVTAAVSSRKPRCVDCGVDDDGWGTRGGCRRRYRARAASDERSTPPRGRFSDPARSARDAAASCTRRRPGRVRQISCQAPIATWRTRSASRPPSAGGDSYRLSGLTSPGRPSRSRKSTRRRHFFLL